jgi:hypothetical protein
MLSREPSWLSTPGGAAALCGRFAIRDATGPFAVERRFGVARVLTWRAR